MYTFSAHDDTCSIHIGCFELVLTIEQEFFNRDFRGVDKTHKRTKDMLFIENCIGFKCCFLESEKTIVS